MRNTPSFFLTNSEKTRFNFENNGKNIDFTVSQNRGLAYGFILSSWRFLILLWALQGAY